MLERERFLAAHYQSGFCMRLSFRLLDEIEKHQQGEPGLWKEYSVIIDELAQGILKGEFNRYNLDNEYVTERYGIGEWMDSYLVCDLAFYYAGFIAAKNGDCQTLDYLVEVDENMNSGFFVGFQPDQKVLRGLVESIEGKALDIASRSRDMESRERSLRGLCDELGRETDEDAVIKKINHFNDGSYVDLAQDIKTLSYVLKRQEYWSEFYELLVKLHFFPLQGSIIKGLHNITDIFAVITQTTINMGRKSLHYLLREQFYKTICEESLVLKNNLEFKQLEDIFKADIQHVLDEFEKEKKSVITAVVDIWLKLFGKEEMMTWLSTKRAEAERKHEKYSKPEIEIVDLMEAEFAVTPEDIIGFQLEDKDFASLVTLAAKSEDEQVCRALMKAFKKNIFAERSYPATNMNEKWFEQVRTIYRCLGNSKLDGLSLLNEERKPLEGYRIDLGDSMRRVQQEAYWLAMLFLSLEETNDEVLFEKYSDVLFMDTKYSVDSMTDDVFTPYYIAELLVSQVMNDQKDAFEKRLIDEIPYLIFVIRVLTANQGVMSEEIRELLAGRIEREWTVERTLLCQNRMVKIEFYDELVKKYLG